MGHHAGDALLVEVARRVEGALHTSDMVARQRTSASAESTTPLARRAMGW